MMRCLSKHVLKILARISARIGAACVLALSLTATPLSAFASPNAGEPMHVPGLRVTVEVERDEYNIPTITATNVEDALFTLGMVHAEDRLFQMDVVRRLFSGTLSELVGEAVLADDIELRTVGLRRGAEESLGALSEEGRIWLDAYTAGVNAYLEDPANPLPPEYAALELTAVAPWTPVDSIVIAKGFAFSLSFDLVDLELTEALLVFEEFGDALGFDGALLFAEDLYRTAPFDPTIAIPDAGFAAGGAAPSDTPRRALPGYLDGRTLRMIRRYRESIRDNPVLGPAMERRDAQIGSNWWMASGAITASGAPILANDPHLDHGVPAIFHEVRLRVIPEGGEPEIDVAGSSFPGSPGVVLGCNPHACWGATTNPMDVTDVYQEQVVIDFVKGPGTLFEGEFEPVLIIPQVFLVNQLGDGLDDNVVPAEVGPLEGGLTFIVPRRNHGPVIDIDFSNPFDITALSVQYSGSRATRELDAIRLFATAESPQDIADALQFFDVGSQNWGFVDRSGNIAYYTSAELPIREDLQLLGAPDGGIGPFLIRDGTHTLMHEWLEVQNPQPFQALDYEILPFDEMPQTVNPESGFIINANNDPVGTTLDNDALNQTRPGGGIFYLNPGYATGFRAGRIQRLFDAALADDGKVTFEEIEQFQGNNQLLDAEVLIPYVIQAYRHAVERGVPLALSELGADPGVKEAVGRIRAWDFSTPTGIQAGYDPGDDPEDLPEPTQAEIDTSVAATIYSVWRGQVVEAVIDSTLERLGLELFTPGSALAMSALRNLLDNFDENQGVGASGVDFFEVEGIDDPESARDLIILQSLRDALDLLAGDAFAAAFDNSTDQDSYRWGYLHRIVFDHPLGDPFNIPTAGGLEHLSEDLLGVARAGGFGAVDASSHSARADSVDDFMFGSGPARRFVGRMNPQSVEAQEVIPGGESGILGSPFLADQLRLWLTNRYHPLDVGDRAPRRHSGTVRKLIPAPE